MEAAQQLELLPRAPRVFPPRALRLRCARARLRRRSTRPRRRRLGGGACPPRRSRGSRSWHARHSTCGRAGAPCPRRSGRPSPQETSADRLGRPGPGLVSHDGRASTAVGRSGGFWKGAANPSRGRGPPHRGARAATQGGEGRHTGGRGPPHRGARAATPVWRGRLGVWRGRLGVWRGRLGVWRGRLGVWRGRLGVWRGRRTGSVTGRPVGCIISSALRVGRRPDRLQGKHERQADSSAGGRQEAP